MNRGSALKWIELIDQYELCHRSGVLKMIVPIRYIEGKAIYTQHEGIYSPCGVLEEFIQKGMTVLSWMEITYMNKEGTSDVMISKDTIKRVKAKTDLSEVDDWWDHQQKPTKEDVKNYILENYEKL